MCYNQRESFPEGFSFCNICICFEKALTLVLGCLAGPYFREGYSYTLFCSVGALILERIHRFIAY